MTFAQFLEAKNIDQQQLAPELRAALVAQWQREQPQPVEPPSELLVLTDDELWGRPIWEAVPA